MGRTNGTIVCCLNLYQAFFFNHCAATQATAVAGIMSFEFGILSFEIFSLSFEIVGLSFKISGLLLLSFKRFFQKTLYHLICKIACLVLKSYFYFSSEVSNVMCLRGNTYTGCTFATLVAGNLSFEKKY